MKRTGSLHFFFFFLVRRGEEWLRGCLVLVEQRMGKEDDLPVGWRLRYFKGDFQTPKLPCPLPILSHILQTRIPRPDRGGGLPQPHLCRLTEPHTFRCVKRRFARSICARGNHFLCLGPRFLDSTECLHLERPSAANF